MLRVVLVTMLLWVFGSCTDTNEEKTYLFKAKGEFAEELKALMEKHAKNGDVEIQELKNTRNFGQESPSILNSFLNDEELSGDIEYGKHIYERTCYRCHGQKADKSSYASARVLNTLSKEELYESLHSYKTDALFGGNNKFIMHEQAIGMTTPEMVSVSAYIYSLSHTKSEAKKPIGSKTKDSNNDDEAVQGTYLK